MLTFDCSINEFFPNINFQIKNLTLDPMGTGTLNTLVPKLNGHPTGRMAWASEIWRKIEKKGKDWKIKETRTRSIMLK